MKKSELSIIISMAIFGTIGLFVRFIPVSSSEIALYRAILASLLLFAYLVITKQKIPFPTIKKQIPLLVISGIAMGFNWILLFEAYKYTTISIATLSYYFAPVIVTLACPILFKEKITKKQWICFLMSTLGILLITGIGDISAGSNHIIGISLGLGAAILYASVVLINKFIKGVEGIHRTFLQFISAVAVLLPYVLFGSGMHFYQLDATGWLCLLIVGFIHTGITYCLYFNALKDIPGQKAAILSYIDPLVAVFISVFLLHESITIIQIIGGVLILGFTLWNEISSDIN